jgi:hypothetical protein
VPIPIDRADHLATVSLAPMGNSWHQEFMAMNQPAYGTTPYGLMTNGERAVGVASGVAFAIAIQEALGLIQHTAHALKDRKARKLRQEIDEERLAVEQLFKASQADPAIIKKMP